MTAKLIKVQILNPKTGRFVTGVGITVDEAKNNALRKINKRLAKKKSKAASA